MKRYEFNKLIRNKIPSRMKEEGVVINSRQLTREQFVQSLKSKLIEEAEEVAQAKTLDELVVEMADVLEVLHSLADAHDIPIRNIEQARIKKKEINGHFTAGDYINYIEVSEDNRKVIEYLESKDRPYVNR